jgi:stalled ribosome rescue protein Dom34
MPSVARWGDGLLVAPYVRALKQNRPVVTILADRRHATVFRYRDAHLEEVAEVQADTEVGDLSDVGSGKRAATHTGMRGETSTDTAHRLFEVETERMLKALIDKVPEIAGKDGFVVVGGTPEMVSATAGRLATFGDRLLENTSLHVGMSKAEVLRATEDAATELSARAAGTLLTDVLDAARSGGRGCLGQLATERALTEMRVETLLVSRTFLRDKPHDADRLIGLAFEQSADVDELAGDAADRLDDEAGGIGAMLRYRL